MSASVHHATHVRTILIMLTGVTGAVLAVATLITIASFIVFFAGLTGPNFFRDFVGPVMLIGMLFGVSCLIFLMLASRTPKTD